MKKLKALFICAVCAILIFSSVIFPEAYDKKSTPVWDGNTAERFESGNGTETDPYIIVNGGQLKLFSGLVNGTVKTYGGKNAYRNEFASAYYKLGADICLNDLLDYSKWSYNPPKNAWTPVGYYTSSDAYASFSGSFDGQGHTISGIYIYSQKNRQGLFGCIENGIVMNVSVTDSYIIGTSYVGAIAGYNYGSSAMIKNCYSSATVYGKNYVGGIAGCNYSMIYACLSNGYVSGDSYTGGICGYGEWFSSVSESANFGSVSGNSYTGGICGADSGSTRIIDCINIGTVYGESYTGAIVGSGAPERVINCYIMGKRHPGIGNSDTDSTTSLSVSEARLASSYGKLDFLSVWTVSASYPYPHPAELSGVLSSSAIWDGGIASSFGGGSGSESDPYKISNPSQLAYLSKLVNSGNAQAGKYFVLTSDIRLSNDRISGWTGGAISFTPIGTEKNPFKGNFNGAGHSISGLYIDGILTCGGLFGNNAGTVKNLKISSGYISGSSCIGAVAGTNSGTISDCTVNAMVNGSSNIGIVAGKLTDGARVERCTSSGRVLGNTASAGIAGGVIASSVSSSQSSTSVYGGESTGGIAGIADNESKTSDCKNSGAVFGCESTGGIAGYSYYYSSVKACLNTGKISGSIQTGGISGYNCWRADVTDCLNQGAVSGKEYTGGISGYNYNNSTVATSYSTGSVSGASRQGGVVGDNASATVKNSYYYTGTASGGINGRDSGGASSLSASASILQKSYSGFDFSGSWVFVLGTNEGYPELRSFRTAYSVRFVDYADNVYHADIYKYGETVRLPGGTPPSYISGLSTYVFESWSGFVSGTKVTSDITYKAAYSRADAVISSDIYSIEPDGLVIKRIAPSTLASTFRSNIKTQYSVSLLDASGNRVADTAYVATGMTLVLTKDNSESRFTLIVTGDTNGDGKASITDFIQIKTYLLAGSGSKNLGGINEQAGDINGDGKISITDFVQFKSHLLGLKIIL